MNARIVQDIPWIQWGAILGASLAAAIVDVRCGRIPNALTLPLWLLGLAQAAWWGSISGLAEALEVTGLLALPFVVSFLLGRGGAGDAKLMGAIGAWLSLDEGLTVFCCVAGAGLILALLRIAAQRAGKNTLSGILASLYVLGIACCTGTRGWRLITETSESPEQRHAGQLTLPYGVAIFVGVCAAAGVHVWRR
jgi:Flp pilus assembly protein protease CpaA